MNFHVLTLFPDMINTVARTSIMGRAIASGAVALNVINIRDFSIHGTKRVDDYPYGGGAGMVMEPEPIFQAVMKAKEAAGNSARVIYLTPAAKVLDQLKAEELAKEQDLILLCGHYEGIDDRVLEEVVDENISIGDYVLTGGELGACVLMDAVSRFVPGVLHNDESSQVESHQDNLLEYPQFTRPEVWHDKAVPKILLSGDHQKILEWRHAQSVERTKERRPDLFEKSFKVTVLYFGSEAASEFAEKLSVSVSCYPALLDYSRAKLVKQKRSFGASDLVIVITDTPEETSKRMERIHADRTPLICISTEEDPQQNRSFFEERGFCPKQSFRLIGEQGVSDAEKLAFRIRKLAGEFLKN